MLLMRGFIKNGEVENFSQFIWNCPGIFYCGDLLPTVTHEDAQYNLLQLATVLNSPLFCQVILDILQHPRFARRLFPNQTDDERSKKITKLIDMYLNSGSDETGDTPLHYASKLGYTDCCKILLANPLCKTLINHSGFTPLSLMFEKDSNQLKKVLTDGLLYVPIFRSYEDLQPFVGRPTNCKELKSLENFQDFGTEQMCKKHSLYFLNAFAGPMSSEMANKFYVTLNEPSSSSLFTYEEVMDIHLIKQQEPSRGLERIGRSLAEELKINWSEFFPILEVYTDLATEEGLQVLEKFFDQRWNKCTRYHPLPSVSTEPYITSIMLAGLYPPQDNPLRHKANTHYCYHKKFFEDMVEVDVEPCSGLHRRSMQYEILGENETFINGSFLSDLDEEIYISLKAVDNNLYPNIHKWKMEITACLQEKMSNVPNFGEFNALKPIPVPKVLCARRSSPLSKRKKV
ncbi:ankyrin repeat and LEM domain-containing protein 2-like [Argiope bruennichi]|uniref:ankyrin repeat and LEM domain-containing protein 2-like n=1 Tax=Argiope bruennichi TaxID=94029 RepID=UPI002494A226|nr:ankyrin repeat and LEM domain-containing protein 2-like [Argiope bruennichi]